MTVAPLTLAAILAMAVATWATRLGGYWLVRRLGTGPRLRAVLDAVPGVVLVALIAPAALGSGPANALAAIVTATAAMRLPALAVVAVATVAAAGARALLG
jgi:uncharacterized membrane protein